MSVFIAYHSVFDIYRYTVCCSTGLVSSTHKNSSTDAVILDAETHELIGRAPAEGVYHQQRPNDLKILVHGIKCTHL